jgi:hypothetical protein
MGVFARRVVPCTAFAAALAMAAVYACGGDPSKLDGAPGRGGAVDATVGEDAAPEGAAPADGPSGASDADAGDARDALRDQAIELGEASAQRLCVLACEAEAGAARDPFYASLRACVCDAGCAPSCGYYCPGALVDTHACKDCVVQQYVDACATEVDCMGMAACVDFADCARACVRDQ